MTLTLHLSPETEARLTAEVLALGKSPETLAVEAIDERLSTDAATPADILPVGEWVKEFRQWVESHPRRNTNLDDSRESIYPDRW